MTNSTMRLSAACTLWLMFAAGSGLAQKKGGGQNSTAAPTAASPGASASNGPFEEEMLSYTAMDAVLQRLAHYACSEAPGSGAKYSGILVLDSTALGALQAYDGFYQNAEAVKDAFERMVNPAGAGGGIDVFSDITNAVAAAATASTAETASSFTIADPTPALALLRQLQLHKDLPTCAPASYAGVYAPKNAIPNGVTVELGVLAQARTDTFRELMRKAAPPKPPEVKKPEAGTTDGGTVTAKPVMPGNSVKPAGPADPVPDGFACVPSLTPVANSTPVVYTISAQDPCIAAFNNIDGTYNSFLAGLNTATGTGQPGLAAILQGDRVHTQFSHATAAAPVLGVYVNVAAAGGTQQDRKNLLTNLFTGDWIRYSGGVSVNFVVFEIADASSQVLVSDIVRYRTPLGTIRKPKGFHNSGNDGDNLNTIPDK